MFTCTFNDKFSFKFSNLLFTFNFGVKMPTTYYINH